MNGQHLHRLPAWHARISGDSELICSQRRGCLSNYDFRPETLRGTFDLLFLFNSG